MSLLRVIAIVLSTLLYLGSLWLVLRVPLSIALSAMNRAGRSRAEPESPPARRYEFPPHLHFLEMVGPDYGEEDRIFTDLRNQISPAARQALAELRASGAAFEARADGIVVLGATATVTLRSNRAILAFVQHCDPNRLSIRLRVGSSPSDRGRSSP